MGARCGGAKNGGASGGGVALGSTEGGEAFVGEGGNDPASGVLAVVSDTSEVTGIVPKAVVAAAKAAVASAEDSAPELEIVEPHAAPSGVLPTATVTLPSFRLEAEPREAALADVDDGPEVTFGFAEELPSGELRALEADAFAAEIDESVLPEAPEPPPAEARIATPLAPREPPSSRPAGPLRAAPEADEPVSGILPIDTRALRGAAHGDDEEPVRTPVARISIARMRAVVGPEASGTRTVRLALVVNPPSAGSAPEAYVTITLPDGKVLHEGSTDAQGRLDVTVEVPGGERELRAQVDTGTKYRNARIPLGEGGVTEHVIR